MRLGLGASVDPGRLAGERWFASKDGSITDVVVDEHFPMGEGGLDILRVEVAGRRPVRYTLPLDHPATWRALADLAASGASIRGAAGGTLVGLPPPDRPGARAPRRGPDVVRPLGLDQSNTSMVIDESQVLKLYRRLEAGRNPEVELAMALSRAPIPDFGGAVRFQPAGSTAIDVAFVQRYVSGAADEFEVLAEGLADWLGTGAPVDQGPDLLEGLAQAGHAVAALHAALLALEGPGLGPRPIRATDAARWATRARRALPTAVRAMTPIDPAIAAELRDSAPAIEASLAPLAHPPPTTALARIHGDLHLGQLIRDGSRVLLVDLEGEPTRSVADRRRRDTPHRDVASMLRSFDHVARSGIRRAGVAATQPAIDGWLVGARGAFLGAYRAGLADRGVAYRRAPGLLHALEVEKELYEFAYASTYLPAWRYAPAAGLRWLLARGPVED